MSKLTILCCVLLLCSSFATGALAKSITIEGYILDSDGKPLPGVEIAVWVVGKEDAISTTKSDKTGKYILKGLTLSGSFDVAYTHSRLMPSVISRLAESENQQISKVLYRKGERVSASVAHDYVQSVDRIAFLALALAKDQRKQFLAHLQESDNTPQFGLRESIPLIVEGTQKDVSEAIEEERQAVLNRLKKLP
jgi:hypothetical protein